MVKKILDEYSELTSRHQRYVKRHPEKIKEINRRYEQTEKARLRIKKYRDKRLTK